MVASLFLTLALLLLVWLVVHLLFRLVVHDTLRYDQNYLWEKYPSTEEEMGFAAPSKKKHD